MAPPHPESVSEGKKDQVYDLGPEQCVTKEHVNAENKKHTAGTSQPKPEPNPNSSSMASASVNDPIASLFAERATRFANTEASARQAELDAARAAKEAEQARLRARRERTERLAREELIGGMEKRGKEWDGKAYEEKVRAQAVMEAKNKKEEDRRERERIKRNIADDNERRRLMRHRSELKYGRSDY